MHYIVKITEGWLDVAAKIIKFSVNDVVTIQFAIVFFILIIYCLIYKLAISTKNCRSL